jgi:hypothetical protein
MTAKQLRRLFIKFRNNNANLNRVSAKQAFKAYLVERNQ